VAARKKSSSSRRYGRKASKKVERAMRERKRGTLRSGRSGKKVTSRKQAIAIGLSEAREEGAKVPPAPRARKSRKSTRKSTGKSAGRSSRKGAAKGARKRSSSRKGAAGRRKK
jgi:hypothetical protein